MYMYILNLHGYYSHFCKRKRLREREIIILLLLIIILCFLYKLSISKFISWSQHLTWNAETTKDFALCEICVRQLPNLEVHMKKKKKIAK